MSIFTDPKDCTSSVLFELSVFGGHRYFKFVDMWLNSIKLIKMSFILNSEVLLYIKIREWKKGKKKILHLLRVNNENKSSSAFASRDENKDVTRGRLLPP